MFFRQYDLARLSLYSYLIADSTTGRAVVVDPQRDVGEAVGLRASGAVLIDTRAPESFASGHVRGSINVGLDGRFAEYAGDVIRPGQEVVLLGDEGRSIEAKIRLARIGFDAVAGTVDGVEAALAEHPDLATAARRLTATDVATWITEDPDGVQLVDVRGPGEVESTGTLPGARNLPLPQLLDHLGELDPAKSTIVFCAGGYRSSIAASTLRAHGFDAVADLIGGFGAWVNRADP